MISKAELKNKSYYWGIGKSVRVAMWDFSLQEFVFLRFKSGWNVYKSIHPEDINMAKAMSVNTDIFIPWYAVMPIHTELISTLENPEI
jgi:hypothetical protein